MVRAPRKTRIALVLALALALAAMAGAACSRDRNATARDGTDDTRLSESPAGEDAASAEASASDEPAVVFETEDGAEARVFVEIADTPAAIERGLMHREHLPADRGMLFIFPREEIHTFWMKNTRIPLDMIFLSAQRDVVGVIAEAEPETTTPRRVSAPSKYVLEVNAGWAEEHGVDEGMSADFVGLGD